MTNKGFLSGMAPKRCPTTGNIFCDNDLSDPNVAKRTLCDIGNALTFRNLETSVRLERRNKKPENSARRHPWRHFVYEKLYKNKFCLYLAQLFVLVYHRVYL
jgi:hypothetical protein